jgi:transcriptional regulator with XRE-family HTH domain
LRYDRTVPTTPDAGPALLKKRLGEELRKLRMAAEVTVVRTASELGCGEGKVRHMENGRNVPSKSDLTVMVALYSAPADVHEELEELRKAATKRGWWSSYRLPTWLHNYVGMEADATLIRAFELELIPGLLQIEDYAQDVGMRGGPKKRDPEEVERGVRARLKRQEILTGDSPATYHAVISEGALHRVKGTSYAAAQYRHLLEMARRPNVTIAVLPFSANLHLSMAGGFTLLDFPAGVSAPVAYYDHVTGGQLEHDPTVVARLSEAYDELAARAMGSDGTTAFIGRWLEELTG